MEETPVSNLRTRDFGFVTPSGRMAKNDYMTTFDEQVAAAEPWFTCLRFAGMVQL